MLRNSTKLTAIAAVALLSGATALNCSKGSSSSAGDGDVKLAFSLPDGLTINSVSYTVNSSSNAPLLTGTINTSDANANVSLDFALQPSNGDTISLTATTTTGVACTGTSAPFNIVASAPTTVNMALNCGNGVGPSAAGVVMVNATVVEGDNCPSITSASVAPAQTSVGSTIAVAAMGVDPDAADTVSYSWTPAANFAAPASANTTYTCTTAGTQTVTLTISDNRQPTACASHIDMLVNCVAVSTSTGGTTGTGGIGTGGIGTGGIGTGGMAGAGTGGMAGAGTGGMAGAGTGGMAGAGTGGMAGAGTGGVAGAGGTTGTGGNSDLACRTCEFPGAQSGTCSNTSATGQGTSVANFGCDSFTNATDIANCNALTACLRGAACQAVIQAATPDYYESAQNFGDPFPCLCNSSSASITSAACSAASSWSGVCATQYVAAAGGAANVLGNFYSADSPAGVGSNLMTCDIAVPCTSASTCNFGQ